jgi:predicted amidohydrolase YtcJ
MGYAETVIEGGRIFRGLHDGFAEAVAIHRGVVVASGARDAVRQLAGPGTRFIDLAGRVAVPAFNDSHQHLLPLGLTMGQVNLRAEQVTTLDELLGRIRAAAAKAPKGAWVLGRGYDHAALDVGRHPTAEELQAAAPDNPVFIVRTCGHIAVASTAALALAEVGHNTPDPQGGAIVRAAGKLTGELQESAMRLVRSHLPKPSDAALVDAIELAGKHMLSEGFTAVMDANVGMAGGIREIDAYRAALADHRLPVRTWVCLAGNPEGIADEVWARGIRPMDGDDMLRFGAMKVFADGSAGGLTAAVSEPYEQGGTGIFIFPEALMHELLAKYHRQGWQLAIHAIGDAAIEMVLSGMEAADAPDAPVAGRRHRIEHCGFTNAGQIARMAARGIEPVPQAIFMREFGDLYVTNLGLARAEFAYPQRTWLEAGLHPPAGSDAPVSLTNPFQNIHVLATRRTAKGTVLGADQRVSVAEAVHAYTWASAYSQFAEDRRGRLVPGQIADVAVLSRDIFACDLEEILTTQADMTIRSGRVVYDRFGEQG